ncbi:L,D-transpeptidase family protein [Sphingomonas sp.]
MAHRAILGLTGLATVGAVALMFAGSEDATAQDSATPAVSPPAIAMPQVDRNVLHAQVILDKLGFGPGVLNGEVNGATRAALRGFQARQGIAVTGQLDQPTLRAMYPYRAWRPTKTIALTPGMLAGPYLHPLPEDYGDMAELDGVPYRSPMEKLAEMFHTTPDVLMALNSRETPLAAGQEIVFPNALPTSRDYDVDDAAARRTLAYLNVGARQPQADHVVVDESEGVLKVMDAEDRVVAQFSATLGSAQFPLPIGEWTINSVSFSPDWRFDPDLIAGTKPGAEVAIVPPGPNNPVGLIWIGLSKEHYGIHGTPEPDKIGQTESNGCIRLTNWDAARLALMVKPGTRAVFQR